MAPSTEAIRAFITRTARRHPMDVVKITAERFDLTRQAVERHLAAMERAGELRSVKEGRRRRWVPATHKFQWSTRDLDEARVFADEVIPVLDGVSENARSILLYGFTEIVNNAKDHSGADHVEVQVSRRRGRVEAWVGDQGIGAFRKIATHLGLKDDRDAVLELAKGRLTTDPDHHAGEGIFFTSRAMDVFVIWSNELRLQRVRERVETRAEDIEPDQHYSGTLVLMEIAENTARTLKQVFDEFCPPDAEDMTFIRTHLSVKLCTYDGVSAVSRSQGKRLMNRLETFRRVVLDFEGVTTVGQGFADEVFRVWVKQHPEVDVIATNAPPDVLAMIKHVRDTGGLAPIVVE